MPGSPAETELIEDTMHIERASCQHRMIEPAWGPELWRGELGVPRVQDRSLEEEVTSRAETKLELVLQESGEVTDVTHCPVYLSHWLLSFCLRALLPKFSFWLWTQSFPPL